MRKMYTLNKLFHLLHCNKSHFLRIIFILLYYYIIMIHESHAYFVYQNNVVLIKLRPTQDTISATVILSLFN